MVYEGKLCMLVFIGFNDLGKSVYMKQVVFIVQLVYVGSFVFVGRVIIGLMDCILMRILMCEIVFDD